MFNRRQTLLMAVAAGALDNPAHAARQPGTRPSSPSEGLDLWPGTPPGAHSSLPAEPVIANGNAKNGSRDVVSEPFRAPMRVPLSPSSRIGLCGDSRSSTDYPFYRQAWIDQTGADVGLLGFSGTNVAHQAAPPQLATVAAYFDAASGPAIAVCLPGGNDTGAPGTVGTFAGWIPGEPVVTPTNIGAAYNGSSFIQAVDHWVRWMTARYADIRGRAALTGSETELQKNAKIAALSKPKIVLCTDIPQQRTNAGDAFSQVTNWERKRAAIIEVGHRNRVHTVDLLRMCAFDMALEVFFPGPASSGGSTNYANNQGTRFMDGVHPNAFGAADMAAVIVADAGL